MTIDELIAQLDASTEGSGELDLAIEIATGRCDPTCFIYKYKSHWLEPHDFCSIVVYKPRSQELPRYTTSLDAALTLVPEGWCWAAGSGDGEDPWAHLSPPEDEQGESIDLHAKTAAIALCVAALMVRK